MKIYVDSNRHCHTTNPNGGFREVDHPFFNGKCQTFIEGYCYDDSNGKVAIYPCKPYSELDAAQREHERQQLIELQNEKNELNTSYTEGVNSI